MAMGARSARLGYRPAADGLRALAIVLVMLHHGALYLVPWAFDSFATGAFLGVDLFFVLSGFLITTLLVERWELDGEKRLGRFYLRRALRLLPAVAFFLVVHLAFVAVVSPPKLSRALMSTLSILTYTTNYGSVLGGAQTPYLGQMWSLAVEEQFYLLFPPCLFALLAMGVSHFKMLGLVVTGILLTIPWRAALFASSDDWLSVYIRTDARLDALLIGVLLAFIYRQRPLARLSTVSVSRLGTAATGCFLAAAMLTHREQSALYQGGFTLVALLAAAMIAVAMDGRWSGCRILEWRPVVVLGRLSYSLYLWHYGVFVLVHDFGSGIPTLVRVLIGVCGAFGGASLSYLMVERPFLKLKGRMESRR